jgi:ubiquinone/menaquinone biosynthesis C-methylase UbiE
MSATPPGEGPPAAPASGFKDHFSGHAADYAAFRPGYPAALFDYLATLPRRRDLAVDCATGNGQAALGLAEHFEEVFAVDASAEQLANARPHERVQYQLGTAEATGIPDRCADLVVAAQALHWFDFDRFYSEARRVLVPTGAVAVFTYDLARVSPPLDRLIDHLSHDIVGSYWPPERRWVDEHYRTVPFPFAEIVAPVFEHEEHWPLDRLLRYIGTWSSVHRYQKATGRDPVKLLQDEIAAAWGPPADTRRVTWPIFMRAGRP